MPDQPRPAVPESLTAAELLAAAADRLPAEDLTSWELRDAFHRCARWLIPTMGVETAHARLQVSTRDAVVGRTTFVTGAPFEIESLDRALGLVGHLDLARPSLDRGTFVDVGANIGTTVIEVLRRYPGARAVAAEPAPENFQLLAQNVLVNGLADRVALRREAISEGSGSVEFETDPENWGAHQVRPEGRSGPAAVTSVPATSLDELVADGVIVPADVSLLWVDAQGHEAHILMGARALLERPVPAVIEYWPHGLRRAGTLERLHDIVAATWRQVIDLERPEVAPRPSSEVGQIAGRLAGEEFTELLLVP